MESAYKQSLATKISQPDEILENLVNVHYAKANCWGTWLLAMQILLWGYLLDSTILYL